MSIPGTSGGDLSALSTLLELRNNHGWDGDTRTYTHLNYISIRDLDVRQMMDKRRVEFADPDDFDDAWLISEPVCLEEMQ